MPPKTVLHTSRGPSPPATPSAEVDIGGFVVTIEGNIAAGKVCVCACVRVHWVSAFSLAWWCAWAPKQPTPIVTSGVALAISSD
jgi:hypothetical protein